MKDAIERLYIEGKTVVITGGAGLLGRKHVEAVLEGKGIPIIIDILPPAIEETVQSMKMKYGEQIQIEGYTANIADKKSLELVKKSIVDKYGHIDVLINNAANNPKVEKDSGNMKAIQFENLPIEIWNSDIEVGLTGAFLCAQVFGSQMAQQNQGVILNISSDLGVIAPDQRIYRKDGLAEDEQTIKPVTYSVIKHALLGLTKYLATYYVNKGIRVNALCPAGVYNGQNDEFLIKLTNLIPMGRMANVEEYKSTILYMISEASSYMTGSTVIVDGGRTVW